jgi:hypothetical protein
MFLNIPNLSCEVLEGFGETSIEIGVGSLELSRCLRRCQFEMSIFALCLFLAACLYYIWFAVEEQKNHSLLVAVGYRVAVK